MLQISVVPLEQAAQDELDVYQQEIDDAGDYADRVALAKRRFSSKNRIGNATFDDIKLKLDSMCRGPRRCMYCEDSFADEVEHFKPKDLYPEVVFAWENYLYSCGRCNLKKNNRFAILDDNDNLISVTRARRAPVVPPQAGKIRLIDPRVEDPLEFMMLDLRDTFEFTSIADSGTSEEKRADYTIEILRLNIRDYLIDARFNAFSSFQSRLYEYVDRKNNGASQEELDLKQEGIRRSPHPTVWAEMIRQRGAYVELSNLFDAAPEALTF